MKKLIILLAIPLLLATCSKDDEAEKQKQENATNGFTINGNFYPLKSGEYTPLFARNPGEEKKYREIAFNNYENYKDWRKTGRYHQMWLSFVPHSSSVVGEYYFVSNESEKGEASVGFRRRFSNKSSVDMIEKEYGKGLLETVIKSKITISKFTGTFISLNLRLEDEEGNIVTAKYSGKIKKKN